MDITNKMARTLGTLTILLCLSRFIAPEPKCFQTLDEMNCIDAVIGDLPNVTQATAKDLKFLQSIIPILKDEDLINFPHMTDFVCLDCQLVFIEANAFCGLRNLIRIELYGNNLTIVNPNLITNCSKIKDVIISWNPTLIIPENDPFLISATLTNLDLTGNEIKGVFPETFSKLPAMKSLSLAGNNLKELGPEVLAPLKNLRSLDLSRNKLAGIALSAIPSRVNKMRLAWNPWHCDCFLFPVIQWSRTRDVEEEVRCFRPHRVKWRRFPGLNCTSEVVDAIRQRKIASSLTTRLPLP